MSGGEERTDGLERMAARALEGLPLRPAPGSLQARVLAAIEHRGGLPWWRLKFACWPVTARVALVACSAYLGWLSISAVIWVMASADSARLAYDGSPWFSAVRAAAQFVLFMRHTFATVVHSIPPDWIYLGAAFAAVLYVGVFGLAAVAYRVLYVRSELDVKQRP
jgi:hypothetical protein